MASISIAAEHVELEVRTAAGAGAAPPHPLESYLPPLPQSLPPLPLPIPEALPCPAANFSSTPAPACEPGELSVPSEPVPACHDGPELSPSPARSLQASPPEGAVEAAAAAAAAPVIRFSVAGN